MIVKVEPLDRLRVEESLARFEALYQWPSSKVAAGVYPRGFDAESDEMFEWADLCAVWARFFATPDR